LLILQAIEKRQGQRAGGLVICDAEAGPSNWRRPISWLPVNRGEVSSASDPAALHFRDDPIAMSRKARSGQPDDIHEPADFAVWNFQSGKNEIFVAL